MKFTYLTALILGTAALSASAQGYKDGIEYYKAGQYTNAIELLERNLNAANTDKAMANYYLGQSYLVKKDMAKARTYFEAGIAADANNPYNYVGLGAIDLKNNQKQNAEANFKKAQSLAKKNSEVIVDIARAYYDVDPVLYAKEIDKMLLKARKDSKNTEPAIYIFEGDRFADQNNYNDAATQYEQAIYFDTDNPEGYVKYANTYFQVVPQYAIQRLEELLQKQPNSALAQRELAEKYYENGEWTKAAKQYGDYIQNPNHFTQDRARYAVLLYAGEEFDKSLAVAKEVLTEDPNNITLQRIVIRDLDKLNRKPEALQASAAMMINPAFNGMYNSADYRLQGQLQIANNDSTAIETIEKGIALFPQDKPLKLEASNFYYGKKDYLPAADFYIEYLQDNKDAKRNDYYTGAMRALMAASNNNPSQELVDKYTDAGLQMMENALDGIEPHPAYLWRKLLLQVVKTGFVKPDADPQLLDNLAQTINEFTAVLDSDSENANPANSNNWINEYTQAYNYLAKYYEAKGDTAAQAQAKEKSDAYKALRNN